MVIARDPRRRILIVPDLTPSIRGRFANLSASVANNLDEQETLNFITDRIIKSILASLWQGIDWDEVDLWDIDWEEWINYAVMQEHYQQNSILAANVSGSPESLTVGEQTLVGRITGGNIAALTVAQITTLLALPQFAKAMVIMDLSGGAVSGVVILHTSRALTLLKAIILYTELSSADAGVTITIGKESSSAYYYTGASEISKALWYELDVTLLQTDVAAGDTVICGTAGGKVGTGEVLLAIEYKVS